jgi:hypothetical protein
VLRQAQDACADHQTACQPAGQQQQQTGRKQVLSNARAREVRQHSLRWWSSEKQVELWHSRNTVVVFST